MAPINFTFVLLFSLLSLVSANHITCQTLDCSDLCNFHGAWINTTSTNGIDHGLCVCDDMYYTLESDIEDHDGLSNHHPEESFCSHRRKSLATVILFHFNPILAPFAAAHWYLGHVGIAIPQMIFGLTGGSLIFAWWARENPGREQAKAMGCSTLVFGVWWFIDAILFLGTTHFKDVHGQELYNW